MFYTDSLAEGMGSETGPVNAKSSLNWGCGPACKAVDNGCDGCARWAGAKVNRENREELGADIGRVITWRMGIAKPWKDLLTELLKPLEQGSVLAIAH